MRVAIIGSGSVGTALAAHLLKNGHPIKYGSRDPTSDKMKALLEQQPGTSAAQVTEAVDWAEAIILAVPG